MFVSHSISPEMLLVFYGALSMLVLSVTLFYLRCCCFLWSPVCVSFVYVLSVTLFHLRCFCFLWSPVCVSFVYVL